MSTGLTKNSPIDKHKTRKGESYSGGNQRTQRSRWFVSPTRRFNLRKTWYSTTGWPLQLLLSGNERGEAWEILCLNTDAH